MRGRLIASGYGLLLAGAYLDNARGPLLSVLKRQLDLSYSQASAFLVSGYAAALVGNLSLLPLLNRYGERRITLGACGVGLVTCALGFLVVDFASSILLGVALGFTIASFGVMCNVLVLRGSRPAEQARTLCGLHAMYGLGSLIAPLALSGLLSRGVAWPWLLLAFPPLSVLAVLGLMRGVKEEEGGLPPVRETSRLNGRQILVLFTLGLYVAGEVVVSMWLSTYLVATRGMAVEETTIYVSGFFFLMATSRLTWFLSLRKGWERAVLLGSLLVPAACVVVGHQGHPWAFAGAGVMGGFFPVFLGRVSHRFPEQARAITVWILVAVQGTLMACHTLVGAIADELGMETAYWFPLPMLLAATACLLLYLRREGSPVSHPLPQPA